MNKLIILFAAVIPIVLILGNAAETTIDSSGELSSYLRYGEGDISEFSIEEREHIIEVRELFQKIFFIFAGAMIVFLASFLALRKQKEFGTMLFAGGALTIILLILLHIIAKNWGNAFASFHELFFKTQWQFPEGSLLIKMFPEEVFYNAFRKIMLDSFLSSIGLMIIGLFLYFKELLS